jgi:hypothetical protein
MRNADRGMDQIECSLRNPQSAFMIEAPDLVLAVTREATFWILDSGVC